MKINKAYKFRLLPSKTQQKSFLIIGDNHLKEEQIFQDIFVYFWNWIKTIMLPDETILQLGDLFHKSIFPGPIIDLAMKTLKQFPHVIVIQGNHDFKQEHGSLLQPLTNEENIEIIDKPVSKIINGLKCLLLPHRYDKLYETYEGKYDYIFGHYATVEDNRFAKEMINLSKLKGVQVHGHVHNHILHFDNNITLGTPYITRFDERHRNEFKIMRVFEDGSFQLIDVPKIFEYYGVEYGQKIESKCPFFKVFIQNAPSVREAEEMYKDFNIYKRIGVKTEIVDISEDFLDSNEFSIKKSLLDYFSDFEKQTEIEKEVSEELKDILK